MMLFSITVVLGKGDKRWHPRFLYGPTKPVMRSLGTKREPDLLVRISVVLELDRMGRKRINREHLLVSEYANKRARRREITIFAKTMSPFCIELSKSIQEIVHKHFAKKKPRRAVRASGEGGKGNERQGEWAKEPVWGDTETGLGTNENRK